MNEIPPTDDDLNCLHFNRCSGCVLNKSLCNPPVLEDAKHWFLNYGVEKFDLYVKKTKEWRLKAKLAVKGTSQEPHIGLYAEGSHRIVEIPQCRVHHPMINEGVELVKKLIVSNYLMPYDEITGRGDLRYLQFIVERSTRRLHISFVLNFTPANKEKHEIWKKTLQKLWNQPGNISLHSLAINFNTRRDNVIFSSEWETVVGDSLLWEEFLGVRVCFHPSSFSQANLDQFESLLASIERIIPEKAKIAEYYAGVGVIGLSLVNKAGCIKCCEINPMAEDCFKKAHQYLLKENQKKISWFHGTSSKYIHWLDEVDFVIVDPPRKGLEAKLLSSLCEFKGNIRLIYVSCGWSSFKKDTERLCRHGWKILKAEGHLFFPGSNHIETLAILEKEK